MKYSSNHQRDILCYMATTVNTEILPISIYRNICLQEVQAKRYKKTKQNEDLPRKLSTFLVNIHLCTFELIQLFANHRLTAQQKWAMHSHRFTTLVTENYRSYKTRDRPRDFAGLKILGRNFLHHFWEYAGAKHNAMCCANSKFPSVRMLSLDNAKKACIFVFKLHMVLQCERSSCVVSGTCFSFIFICWEGLLGTGPQESTDYQSLKSTVVPCRAGLNESTVCLLYDRTSQPPKLQCNPKTLWSCALSALQPSAWSSTAHTSV